MKKFKFRLEQFLKYQKSLLRMVEINLFEKNRQYAQFQEMLSEYHRKRQAAFFAYRIENGIYNLRQSELYRESLNQKIESVNRDLLILENHRNQIQKDYTTRCSRCRALELLEEKELGQYKSQMIRYKDEVIDDVWLARMGWFDSEQ